MAWHIQLNVQRSRFYDQPAVLYDFNGQPILGNIGVQTNLNASLLALTTIKLLPRLHVGAGLGVRGLLYARTDYGTYTENGETTPLKLRNHSQPPLLALLPAELAFQISERWRLANRWEWGLTRASRIYQQERHLWSMLEVGFRL
jgi:hypothetical protein